MKCNDCENDMIQIFSQRGDRWYDIWWCEKCGSLLQLWEDEQVFYQPDIIDKYKEVKFELTGDSNELHDKLQIL